MEEAAAPLGLVVVAVGAVEVGDLLTVLAKVRSVLYCFWLCYLGCEIVVILSGVTVALVSEARRTTSSAAAGLETTAARGRRAALSAVRAASLLM